MPEPTIQPIETRYNGYRFRSRLEARWAVFFDTLGIAYEYEPNGYDTRHGWYLPDFYLPAVRNGLWVEIKADAPSKGEEDKLHDLCRATQKAATFRCGDPYLHHHGNDFADGVKLSSGRNLFDTTWLIEPYNGSEVGWDISYMFCVCPQCGKPGMEFDGRGARVCGNACLPDDDKGYSADDARLVVAATAAREARFESARRRAA